MPRPERGVGQGTFCMPRRRGSLGDLGSTPSFFGNTTMAQRSAKAAIDPLDTLPKLLLDDRDWRAIFNALALSPQRAKIVELLLRSAIDRQIALALGLAAPTVRTYLQRVFLRMDVRDRMELAMRVLDVSHQVLNSSACHRKGCHLMQRHQN